METESEVRPETKTPEVMKDRPLVLRQLEPLQHREDSLLKGDFTGRTGEKTETRQDQEDRREERDTSGPGGQCPQASELLQLHTHLSPRRCSSNSCSHNHHHLTGDDTFITTETQPSPPRS